MIVSQLSSVKFNMIVSQLSSVKFNMIVSQLSYVEINFENKLKALILMLSLFDEPFSRT